MFEDTAIEKLGFSLEKGGAHTARTMMFDELSILLDYVEIPNARKSDYKSAIQDKNCLAKRSTKSRILTFRHLVDLYSLDVEVPLFRALIFFWHRDLNSRPLLGLLCAYCRDAILRQSATLIQNTTTGSILTRQAMQQHIDSFQPGRFSEATLRSTAQNVNSTWTQSGHLSGRACKIRTIPIASAASVSYALMIGYLTQERGLSLFQTEYMRLLDCSVEKAIELAEEASRKGWIVFKRVGNVMEVVFPQLKVDCNIEGKS
ncbi:MAG: hypothetical protein WCJ40_10930 [Planctomycetota bacterium]